MNEHSIAVDVKRVSGFPTDANVERQSASIHCAEINSANVGFSTFSLSVIPVIMQTSVVKKTNGPLGSPMNSMSVTSVLIAHVNISWGW